MGSSLKIDTSDLALKVKGEHEQDQLLTPLPSATEDRRGSFASSGQWSFTSYPGSASSLTSSRGPATPLSTMRSLSNGRCGAMAANLPVDGFFFDPQASNFLSSLENIHSTPPYTPNSPDDGFSIYRDVTWPWQRLAETQLFHMPQHTMMPAAGDFGSALESSLGLGVSNASTVSTVHHYDATAGSAETHMPLDFAQENLDFLYEAYPEDLSFHHALGVRDLQQNYDMMTIAPPDAFTQAESSSPSSTKDLKLPFEHYDHEFSPRSPSPAEQFESLIKTEEDPDYTPSKRNRASRSIVETPRGGKGVSRKAKIRSTAAKRRLKTTIKYEVEGISVTHSGDLKAAENGYLVPTAKKVAKKQCCGKILPDGRTCQAAFERVEHLKRHQHTHLGVKDFDCPKCERPFNRNDNLQEHYKTHLLLSRSGRNERCSFEEIFALIRRTKTKDVAEKAIKSLKDWKDSDRYLRDLEKFLR